MDLRERDVSHASDIALPLEERLSLLNARVHAYTGVDLTLPTKKLVGWRYIRQAERDDCPQGHVYTVENTRYTAKGYRKCRACERVWRKRTRERKAA